MDTSSGLTPFIFNTIQNNFIQNFALSFSQINHYAIQLFYLLATLELCLFGLIWALKQQQMFGLFFFKIIKLGFIFFIITNYATLLNSLVNGLAVMGLGNGNAQLQKLIFSPDLLWRFGFDSGISLLQLAVQYGTTNLGMTAIYLILGFGILLMIALIACQLILLVVGFYLLALMGLIFLPFGAFGLTEKLFTSALHGLIQAAVRIFALIVVLGIGAGIWLSMSPSAFSQSTTLDQPLGLFVATLVITILCWKIPNLLANSVGELGGDLFTKTTGESVESTSVSVGSPVVAMTQIAAATNISSTAAGLSSNSVAAGSGLSMPVASASTVHVSTSGTPGLAGLNQNVSELTKAVKVQKEGVSRETLNKLKATFKEALNNSGRQK